MKNTTSPLYVMLADICRRIESLDPSKDSAEFASLLLTSNPALFTTLPGGVEGRDAPEAARRISVCQIEVIKEIPTIVSALLDAVDRNSIEPAVRCALVGTLGYLVQPRDLLPDKMPGGFGYVDDCMMLRAASSEFLAHLPPEFTTVEKERRLLDFLSLCIPPDRIGEFQAEIEGIWRAFHAYLWQPGDDVEDLTDQIIDDPLGTEIPNLERIDVPLTIGPKISVHPDGNRLALEENSLIIQLGGGGSVTINESCRIDKWS